MHLKFSAIFRPGLVAALGALACSNSLWAKEQNPTSKLYIANLAGGAEIDTGDRIEDLNEKSVHNAQGTVIETKPEGSNAMVFSNGTGVYLIPDSRMEVQKFRQEPFVPNRTDLETEPSISQTSMNVSRGAVGICPPRLVAGSTMNFSTGLGSVSVRSGNLVVESDANETRISLIEGDVTVRAGLTDAGGNTLRPGQQAVIRNTPGGPPTVELRPIPPADLPKMENYASQACMARKSVYFDVDERKNDVADSGLGSGVDDSGSNTEESDDGSGNTARSNNTSSRGNLVSDGNDNNNFSGPNVFLRDSESGSGSRPGAGVVSNNTVDVLVPVVLVPTDPPGTTATTGTSNPDPTPQPSESASRLTG